MKQHNVDTDGFEIENEIEDDDTVNNETQDKEN